MLVGPRDEGGAQAGRSRGGDGSLVGLVIDDRRDKEIAYTYIADRAVVLETPGRTLLVMRDGVLQPLLRQWTLPAQEIHAVFSSPRLVPTKVSGFVDFLLPHFGGDWWAGAATSQPAS
mgnify:CR=1 FL=1